MKNENFFLGVRETQRLVADLDFRVFRFTFYGKERIKTFNVSPDVYIQLLLQLTYHKYEKKNKLYKKRTTTKQEQR